MIHERGIALYRIKAKRRLNDTVTLLEVEAPLIAGKAKAGQFIIFRVDMQGERIPLTIDNSNYEIETDAVIMAIGTSPNPLISATTEGLETNKWGCIVANDRMETTRQGVYAGGDTVSGAATVIMAMGAGKTAARSMDAYIRKKVR